MSDGKEVAVIDLVFDEAHGVFFLLMGHNSGATSLGDHTLVEQLDKTPGYHPSCSKV